MKASHGERTAGLHDDALKAADDFLAGVRSMDVVFSRGGLLARVNWQALERVEKALDAGLASEFVLLLGGIAGPLYGPGFATHKAAYASIEAASSIAMEAIVDDFLLASRAGVRTASALIDACSAWIAGESPIGETAATKIGAMMVAQERAYVLARYAPALGSMRFLHAARPAVSHAQTR